MSRENVELVKALIPQGTDIIPLFRDEDTWARTREAISPFFTEDFQSVMVFPAQTRTYAGLEGLRKTGSTGLSRGRHTEPASTS